MHQTSMRIVDFTDQSSEEWWLTFSRECWLLDQRPWGGVSSHY